MNKTFICPVCGYTGLHEIPFKLDHYPSYEICPCCMFQFGLDDDRFEKKEDSFIAWREKWVENGYPWFSKARRPPDNWNPQKQLEALLTTKSD